MKNNRTETPPAAVETECTEQALLFQDLGSRKVLADFSGGFLSSDGGALLLRQVDLSLQLSNRVAACFSDFRSQRFVEHTVPELVAQRIFALAMGYEDLNDHNQLRLDPVIAAAVGKTDPLGLERVHFQDRGKALAGASTLNRMELSAQKSEGYHKLPCDPERMEDLVLQLGTETLERDTKQIILDIDATDDPLHGSQEGAFYHGYYHNYCYLPLYICVGDVPLWAQLRTSDHDACEGTNQALEKIVPALRKRCPQAEIILRGDSGFCRESILQWCEANGLQYVIGLARNARLEKEIEETMIRIKERQCLCGTAVRDYKSFVYQTRDSWSRSRRVIGKAEITLQGTNPRFVVTNLGDEIQADTVYEEHYCPRGQMENIIKQQQLDLAADRTSTAHMASNQLRLWFSTLAYMMLERLRRWGLYDTLLSRATAGTVRLKLLKMAAKITVSTRRIYIQFNSSFPLKELWQKCLNRLSQVPIHNSSG